MSKIIKSITGSALPIYGNDIDTDRVIPARFLKELTFEKMGDYLFYDVRFDEKNNSLDHPTNDSRFSHAKIMIVQNNFGCGSSREHAAQAVKRYGIDAIIGESFSEIFSGNCKAIGVPLVTTDTVTIKKLQEYVEKNPTATFTIDLERKTVTAEGFSLDINLPESSRVSFLEGTWDVVSLLLAQKDATKSVYSKLPYTNNFS
jgi:3-isopropylmalate/(R)-2-methylmalate dehydratase small subunit